MNDKKRASTIRTLRIKSKLAKFFGNFTNNLWIAGIVALLAIALTILGKNRANDILYTCGFVLMGVDLMYLFFMGKISSKLESYAKNPQMNISYLDDPILCPYCQKELLEYSRRGKQNLNVSDGMFYSMDKYYGIFTCPRCHHESELEINGDLFMSQLTKASEVEKLKEQVNNDKLKREELHQLDELDKLKKHSKE